MTRLSFIKGALIPADEETRKDLGSKHKVGDVIDVEVLNPRRVKFNSLIHVTLDEIAKMVGSDMKALRAEILIETGRASAIKLRDGVIVWALPSMSRSSWTMKDLESFWDDAREYIKREIMISLDAEQQERVNNLLNDGVL
jgi:hypothetical protein